MHNTRAELLIKKFQSAPNPPPADSSSTSQFDNPSFSRRPVYDPLQKQPDILDQDTLTVLNAQVYDCCAYLKFESDC